MSFDFLRCESCSLLRLSGCNGWNNTNERLDSKPLRSIILVGIHCGLRLRSEALTLRWRDIGAARRTVTLHAAYAKNGQTRSVPLNSTVRLPRTGEYVFVKPDGEPYTAVRNSFDTACRLAGLKDVPPIPYGTRSPPAIDRERRGPPYGPRARGLVADQDAGAIRARVPVPGGRTVEGLVGKFPYAIHYAGETTTRTATVIG